jgi:phosphoserine phosphatase RsbU/P
LMMAKIVYQLQGQEIVRPLDKDEITVGRLPDSDIVIPLATISRKHARIYRDGNSWRVADLGSKYGTRINNLVGVEKVLQDGDQIFLRDFALTFLDETSAVRQSSPLSEELPGAGTHTVFRSIVDFSALASARPQAERPGVRPTDRLQRLVTIVAEASKTILTSVSLEETFQKMLDLIFAYLAVQRGFIMLWDYEKQDFVTKCVKTKKGESEETGAIRFSRTIAEKVYREKIAVLTLDAQSDSRLAAGESIRILGIRSAMAAPLWSGEKVEGLIYVDTSLQIKAFDDFDLDVLSALGNQLAVAMERARLQGVAIEKEKLDRELSVARDIQMAVLPHDMPALAGYDVAGMSKPADQTGGDTFDLISLDGNRLVVLLGDATGHGIGPALSVTQVRSMLRIAVRLGADLDSAFTQINNQLTQDLSDNRFVTAFLGLLDNRSHRVEYHSGGQAPILHYHADRGEFEWKEASTIPMGFMVTMVLNRPQPMELAPGDILALITDGIYEYEDVSQEQFGKERVAEVIREHHDKTMATLMEKLHDAVKEFGGPAPQNDDITVVLLRRLPQ